MLFMEYVVKKPGHKEEPRLTEMSTLYVIVVIKIWAERRLNGIRDEWIDLMIKEIPSIKKKTVALCKEHWDSEMF